MRFQKTSAFPTPMKQFSISPNPHMTRFQLILPVPDHNHGHRVAKKVLNTYYYVSHDLWVHADRTKIGGVSLISDTSWFFITRLIFSYDLTLSPYNFETEAWSPKPIIFSKSWVRKHSVATVPERCSRWKFSGTERFTKKFTFLPISVHTH